MSSWDPSYTPYFSAGASEEADPSAWWSEQKLAESYPGYQEEHGQQDWSLAWQSWDSWQWGDGWDQAEQRGEWHAGAAASSSFE
ncbi:unnamed protein product, partial [Symbiodinium sp. KB8]